MSTLLILQIQFSLAVLLALLLRCCMTRLPKRWSYGLWIIVFLRLLFPVSMESPLGILPGEETLGSIWQQLPVSENGGMEEAEVETAGAWRQGDSDIVSGELQPSRGFYAETEASAGRQYRYFGGFLAVWLAGVAAVLGYNLYGMFRIHKRIQNAGLLEEGVYVCPGLETPFAMGLPRPRIYLPAGLDPDKQEYILCHERIHLGRRDYLVKGTAFLLTAFYWYNPLVWVAFGMLERDMEMSCDEAVVWSMGNDIRKAYSQSLLDFAVGGKRGMTVPLAFGGNGVKQRVSNILKGKRGGMRGVLAGILVLTIAIILVFTTRSREEEPFVSPSGGPGAQKARPEESVPQDRELLLQLEETASDQKDEAQSGEEPELRLELLRQEMASDQKDEPELRLALLRQDMDAYQQAAEEAEQSAGNRKGEAWLAEEIYRQVIVQRVERQE